MSLVISIFSSVQFFYKRIVSTYWLSGLKGCTNFTTYKYQGYGSRFYSGLKGYDLGLYCVYVSCDLSFILIK